MRRFFDEIFVWAKFPYLVKVGWLRHKENGPLPLKARPGWFVQQPIIGGLNQPPRLRPLRRLRDFFLMGAATPPLPRRGVRLSVERRRQQEARIQMWKGGDGIGDENAPVESSKLQEF